MTTYSYIDNHIMTEKEIIKHTLKLDYFVDLKVSFDDLQKVISMINLLALMATDNVDFKEVPELYYTHIETDSILFTFEAPRNYLEKLKSIIVDINLIRHNLNIPDGHYLVPIFNRLFQLLKEKQFCQCKYLILCKEDFSTIESFNEYLFKWIKLINAINGKSIEEKPLFESKEEVIEAYRANKEDLGNSSFNEISLDGVDLSFGNFKDSEFIKTHLMKANLEFSILENADMTDAILIGTSMANAIMTKINLTMAQLIEANLSEANLINANLTRAFLIGANIRRSNLTGAILTSAILARADASRGILVNCNALNANLVGINAVETDFSGSDFSEADLTTARLQGAKINNTNFSNSKLLEANLSSVTQYEGANFTDSDWWNMAEVSEELLDYLRIFYPCSLEEDQRVSTYKNVYGKDPSEEVIMRQNFLLGLIEEINEQDDLESDNNSEEITSETNLDDIVITPEYLEKLAMEGLDDPLI